MAKPYRLLRQMSEEAQQKAAAEAREVVATRPGSSRDRGEATKCTDATSARATGYADARHPQDEPLELSNNVNWCRSCLKRRVLCAFGQCVACHERRAPPRWRRDTRGICAVAGGKQGSSWNVGRVRRAERCTVSAPGRAPRDIPEDAPPVALTLRSPEIPLFHHTQGEYAADSGCPRPCHDNRSAGAPAGRAGRASVSGPGARRGRVP